VASIRHGPADSPREQEDYARQKCLSGLHSEPFSREMTVDFSLFS
jgi:hypothetical protein